MRDCLRIGPQAAAKARVYCPKAEPVNVTQNGAARTRVTYPRELLDASPALG